MLEVMEARTRAEMRAFFKAGRHCGYMPKEVRYFKRFAVPPLSLLSQNGPQAYLVAKRDGKPVFRALTGVDVSYNEIKGKKTGYFSLFDGEKDKEAAEAVLSEIYRKQRAWGTDELIGPISPDGSGFFMGAGEGDFEKSRGIFTGPDSAFSKKILSENGFREIQVENAFYVTADNNNPLSEIMRKAEKRFQVEIQKMKTGLFRDRWVKDILSVSKDAPEKEMRLILERVRNYIDKRHSYTASVNGACAGYLLSLKPYGGILRATTLITDTDHFSAPVVLSLIGRYLEDIKKNGEKTFEVSVINHQNIRSERLVLRYGGVKMRSYTLFTKNAQQN